MEWQELKDLGRNYVEYIAHTRVPSEAGRGIPMSDFHAVHATEMVLVPYSHNKELELCCAWSGEKTP